MELHVVVVLIPPSHMYVSVVIDILEHFVNMVSNKVTISLVDVICIL